MRTQRRFAPTPGRFTPESVARLAGISALIETELVRLRQLKEIQISVQTAAKLSHISPATIDRLLRPKKEAWKLHHRSATTGSGLLAKKIPLRMGGDGPLRVGDVDMDLVLHCGGSTAGEYGHSLSTLDLGSAW